MWCWNLVVRRSHDKRSFLLALLAWFNTIHFLGRLNICALRHRISRKALLSIGGRTIVINAAALPQTVQKISLHLLLQQQLLMLHIFPLMSHAIRVVQSVTLADELQQPLDESGGHVLFRCCCVQRLGPKMVPSSWSQANFRRGFDRGRRVRLHHWYRG